jgi:hypothetical protein
VELQCQLNQLLFFFYHTVGYLVCLLKLLYPFLLLCPSTVCIFGFLVLLLQYICNTVYTLLIIYYYYYYYYHYYYYYYY